MTSVLVSGASVAGPALAYWLHRYGFDVTVVEQADAPRPGGYPIDIRGSAVTAVERMGLLPPLREATIRTRTITVLGRGGRRAAAVDAAAVMGSDAGRDLEVPRGELTALLWALTRDRVPYVFGDRIRTLEQDAGGVHLTFDKAPPRTVDLVIGADGVHSATRRAVFGPEEDFRRYLGLCFAGFSVPNTSGLSHEVVLQAAHRVSAALYAVRDSPRVHALLTWAGPEPERGWGPAFLADRLRETAPGNGIFPDLLAALSTADDVYHDTVSQIRMPAWSAGRVALVGDAAYAPSFVTGQGTSLALAGAYVLAGELRRAAGDPARAFPAYAETMHDYVRRNQHISRLSGLLFPRRRWESSLRGALVRLAPLVTRAGREPSPNRPAAALHLPAYGD